MLPDHRRTARRKGIRRTGRHRFDTSDRCPPHRRSLDRRGIPRRSASARYRRAWVELHCAEVVQRAVHALVFKSHAGRASGHSVSLVHSTHRFASRSVAASLQTEAALGQSMFVRHGTQECVSVSQSGASGELQSFGERHPTHTRALGSHLSGSGQPTRLQSLLTGIGVEASADAPGISSSGWRGARGERPLFSRNWKGLLR
jgi:hypothetical protein